MRSVMLTTGVLCGVVSWVAARSCAADAWSIYTVDGGSIGPRTSLALDPSSGYPRISYQESSNRDLKYAVWNGSSWDIQTVDTAGDVGDYTSLALDASGYARISYHYTDWPSGALKYAAWNGSSWDIETVDSAGYVGLHTSLALDASGYPRISYDDARPNEDLKYAAWNGTGWDIETVDSAGNVGYDASLALDASGYAHISYLDFDNRDLKYAAWNGTSWDIQTVDTAGDVGRDTSLALDASRGYPRISYFDYTNGDLKYAAWNGSSWDIQTVDSAGRAGYYTSLALAASGYPHISYYDQTNRDLKYAVWNGSSWDIQAVDTAGDVDHDTSLALDADEFAHISYSHPSNGDLKYATTRPAEASHELRPTGYYMISYPLTPTSAMVHDLLCDDLGHVAGSYYLWRWNADTQAYESATSPPDACLTTPLNVNEGVWLLAQATTIDVEGALPSGRQTIALETGWNMVRAPYAVIMDSLVVDNAGDVRCLAQAALANWVLATFYYSHDGSGSYSTLTINQTPPDTLSLWYGYWVLAGLPCSLIVGGTCGPPPPPMATPAGRRDTVQFAWAFDIQASSASSGDTITIAAADAASDDFDGFALDRPKPPAAPGEGRLRMVLRGKGRRGRASPPYNEAPGQQTSSGSELAMATKAATQEEVEWQFTVSGGVEGEPVTLSWPELRRLPKDRVAILTDRDTGRRTFMRTRARYEFASPDEESSRSFAVTVKPAQQASLLISSFSVVPLRAGRGAELRFGLSADATVDISVLNVAGRVVQRVREALATEAGSHTITWPGRSMSDTALPNGTYLCLLRAKAPDGQQARAVVPIALQR